MYPYVLANLAGRCVFVVSQQHICLKPLSFFQVGSGAKFYIQIKILQHRKFFNFPPPYNQLPRGGICNSSSMRPHGRCELLLIVFELCADASEPKVGRSVAHAARLVAARSHTGSNRCRAQRAQINKHKMRRLMEIAAQLSLYQSPYH